MASPFLFALSALAILCGSVLGRPNVAIAGAQVTAQYIIRNVTTGKCIDIANGSTAAGDRVAQYICHGGQNQRFRFDFLCRGPD